MRTMKKVLAAGLTAVMAMSLMVGCGSKKDDSSSKTYNLGIIQFAEHGSLDNCRKGFLKGLESEGIKEGENLKITYKNSQADIKFCIKEIRYDLCDCNTKCTECIQCNKRQ